MIGQYRNTRFLNSRFIFVKLVNLPITIPYPKIIQFSDGVQLELTNEDWKKRKLVVETDKTEQEIRGIFYTEGFSKAGMEFVKEGQIGDGLVRKFEDWQVHVRLFRNGNHIQLDAEAEVSSAYIEHLTHGWISAFKESWIIIERHFGQLWVYHKGVGKYVTHVIQEGVLELQEPKSKTDVALTIGAGVTGILIGFLIMLALKK